MGECVREELRVSEEVEARDGWIKTLIFVGLEGTATVDGWMRTDHGWKKETMINCVDQVSIRKNRVI